MAGSSGKYDWIVPAASAAVAGYGAYAASKNARQDREQASEENELDRRYRAAVEETSLNPFRHQLAQGQTLGTLDVMANAQLAPARYSMPGIPVPQLRGGFQYTPSADLQRSAKLLQRDVASGRTAPTMTDPANYGQTGALNLNAAGGASAGAPGTAMPRGQAGAVGRSPGAAVGPGTGSAAVDPASLLTGVARRNEGAGGVGSGMAKGAALGAAGGKYAAGVGALYGAAGGAIIGGIVGAATKNAKTAMTDLSVPDAKTVIRNGYQQYLGRDASDAELESQLAGIGFDKARHKWVGEQGVLAILQSLRQAGGRNAESHALAPDYEGLFA